MQEHHCGATLVCDAEGRIQGIFTERDLLLQSDRYQPGWLDLPVVQVMTEGPVTANVSSTVRQVVELMRSGGYRHVPVVDDKGRPRGIVSVRDVLTFVAEHFPEECLNLPPDPSLETRGLYGG
jgi:CBS domain-containing protein